MRVGIGYDVHALAPGRALVLGGVEIPHGTGLAGHSDADVLCHALADALLGAAGLGDLGSHFQSSDPELAGVSSLSLLEQVAARLAQAGWVVINVDAVIVAAAPRLAPHVATMRSRVAAALGAPAETISIKATSTDGLGVVGRGEGIAAQAVALLAPAGPFRPG